MAGIVVVGGGVAGLVCAWRLRNAGHDVEVLEREAVPGGRVRSEVRGVFRVERGAGFLTSGHRNVLGVLRALGLEAALRPLGREGEGVPGAVLRGRQIEPCVIGRGPGIVRTRSRLLTPVARLGLGRLGAQLARHRALLDPWQPERAARLEFGEDMPIFARRVAGEVARDRLLVPVVAALAGCEPEDLSAAALLLVLSAHAAGSRPLGLVGGLGSLTRALAQRVPVRTGCEVFSVESARGGVRVRYQARGRERSALADGAVLAVPAPLVPLLCPTLEPEERDFFESVRYAPAITVNLMLDHRPELGAFGVGVSRSDGSGLRALFAAHRDESAVPERGGLLTVSLGESALHRLARAKDAEIAAFAIDALADTAVGRLEPVAVAVHRFEHARPIFPTGALSRLANFAVREARAPRLAFAGDYLVAPSVEGALTSGMRAASRVLRALEERR